MPCVFPSGPRPQQSERLTGEFFHYNTLHLDQKAQETILRLGEKGRDGRRRIQKTDQFPYSAQVYFVARFPQSPKGTCAIGSGTFIDKHVILTAAHVVYSREKGGLYKTLECLPAANEQETPFGFPRVQGVKIANAFIENEDREHDYALVFIDRPLGTKTGYLGLAALANDKLKKLTITIAGYPSDKIKKLEEPTMWGMSGTLTRYSPQELQHDVDTAPGQSGSGIWYARDKGEYYLIGVHAYGIDDHFSYNHGPRLTSKRGKGIRQWIKAFEDNILQFDNGVPLPQQLPESKASLFFKDAPVIKASIKPVKIDEQQPLSAPFLSGTLFEHKITSQPSKQLTARDILEALEKVKLRALSIGNFVALINRDATLTHFDIMNSKIGIEGAKGLAEALKTNTTLTQMTLYGIGINNEEIKIIAPALEKNTTLTSLHLGNNDIGREGGIAIAAALEKNTALTYLSLTSNSLGDEGAQSIIAALEKNKTLQALSLKRNNITDAGARMIMVTSALEKNQTLTMLDLLGNKFSNQGKELLLNFNRHRPTLCIKLEDFR